MEVWKYVCTYCMYVNTTMQTNPCAFLMLLGNKLSYLHKRYYALVADQYIHNLNWIN